MVRSIPDTHGSTLLIVNVFDKFTKVGGLWHTSSDEETYDPKLRKSGLEHTTRAYKVSSGRHNIIKQGYYFRSGVAEVLFDAVGICNLIWSGSDIRIMSSFHRVALYQKLTYIEWLCGWNCCQHSPHAVIIQRIVLFFGRWNGNQCGLCKPFAFDRPRKRLPNLSYCAFFVLPFRSTSTIDRLFEIKHELIGCTKAKALAGGIFAKEETHVLTI